MGRGVSHIATRAVSMGPRIAGVAIILASAVMFAATFAAAHPSPQAYHGCYSNKTGSLRIIVPSSPKCKHGETAISWNQMASSGAAHATSTAKSPTPTPTPRGPTPTPTLTCTECLELLRLPIPSASTVLCPNCDLTNANLPDASLPGAYLPGINLTNATVSSADLTGANLSEANLTNANLAFANLGNAELLSATLTLANFANVIFVDATLRYAVGVPATMAGATWINTTCPDGTNSDANADKTCMGHFLVHAPPIPPPTVTVTITPTVPPAITVTPTVSPSP